ncbi:MAG: hypothetical protein A4E64_01948 [Syntrophorhabdus sp. PtaU1.Bin058]|nr:MAG: hypothetical protein A4E64_01948 [Syntrophorhabdus sp. PtaU1.Bin058]
MNQGLFDYLRDFNSKERFFLVGQALGNPGFKISREFRNELAAVLHLQIPEVSFCAMDFHLDWLYASLQLNANNGKKEIHSNDAGIIKGQQEDVDLLVGYQVDNTYHIIIVEAKAFTGWTNSQMDSKADRLREIFGDNGNRWQHVFPHFLLMSPKKPVQLQTARWPKWMIQKTQGGQPAPAWIKLQVPSTQIRVSRCDKNGKPNTKGDYWTIIDR